MTSLTRYGAASADGSSRFARDGWDARLRIGAVVPHADVGPECELGAMAGPMVSIHAGRLHFSAMRAGGEMDPTIPHDPIAAFAAPPHVDRVVESLGAAPLDVIALAFTSSAYKHGLAGEEALVARLAPAARQVPITSTCLAAAAALRASGAARIALVHPPWFDADLDQAGARYFAAQGFHVVHHAPCGLPSGQRFITPEGLHGWIRKVVKTSGAETVVVLGNGQRAVGVIAAAEADLGITVLTANQLILWHALRLTGFAAPVVGYGRLFELPLVGAGAQSRAG
jgi:maleate isomerase